MAVLVHDGFRFVYRHKGFKLLGKMADPEFKPDTNQVCFWMINKKWISMECSGHE